MAYTIKNPSYINDFKCIGKDCELHCCQEWEILWFASEVEKLKSAGCSDSLKSLIETSFKATEDDERIMKIIFRENGDCPFHDENDRLCLIQKELGEEYLSRTCTIYPMTGIINNNIVTKFRVLSCPAVYDLITSSQNACDIYINSVKPDAFNETGYFSDSIKDVNTNPILKYRNELFDFFYNILSNKNVDIVTSVISGILAASKLDEFANKDEKRIPEVIKALTPQMTNPATLSSLKSIAPNYSIKIPVLRNFFSALNSVKDLINIISGKEDEENIDLLCINPEQYGEYADKFRKCFPKDFVMRNIVRSLYMDMQMPFNDKTDGIFGNYVYFAVCMAAIEYLGVCIAACYDDEAVIKAKFKTAVCNIGRNLCHSTATKKNVLEYIKNINCYTSGYVSIIMK